jgi:hypothetical protein
MRIKSNARIQYDKHDFLKNCRVESPRERGRRRRRQAHAAVHCVWTHPHLHAAPSSYHQTIQHSPPDSSRQPGWRFVYTPLRRKKKWGKKKFFDSYGSFSDTRYPRPSPFFILLQLSYKQWQWFHGHFFPLSLSPFVILLNNIIIHSRIDFNLWKCDHGHLQRHTTFNKWKTANHGFPWQPMVFVCDDVNFLCHYICSKLKASNPHFASVED